MAAAEAGGGGVGGLPTVVIDNGGGTVKVGWATDASPVVVDNAKAKTRSAKGKVLIGAQIEETRNKAGLLFKRPVQKGFVLDAELQREVWASAFSAPSLNVQPNETAMLVTEPLFNFDSVRTSLQELAFEEFGFAALYRAPAADMAAYKACTDGAAAGFGDGCVVVDSGFSATNVVPYVGGRRIDGAIRRVDVGGKLLTHALKDSISYRKIDVSNETYVVNQMKEDISVIVQDYMPTLRELRKARGKHPLNVEYVLPDFGEVFRGFISEDGPADPQDDSRKRKATGSSQTVQLGHERFSIPELIFRPSDIGIDQAGVGPAVAESIAALTPLARPLAYANVVAVGGNAGIPGFRDRLYSEVRADAPSDFTEVNIAVPDEPSLYAWRGGCAFAQSDGFSAKCVTKAEYAEKGHTLCFKRFDQQDL
eukprot:m.459814 g.459814  ORF g.459814 m.459814 type:complete len:423 (-) comp21839_c0_seq1:56-1324(-)